MQTGQHMGKIVIRMPEDSTKLPVKGSLNDFSLPSDASYILVGGMGGLGRSVATWMVEHGARDLVFLSPSAGKSEEARLFLKEIESQQCSATAVAGSVAKMEDVHRALSACRSRIGGVIQMSMVMKVGSGSLKDKLQ